jgi:hypothetical protein
MLNILFGIELNGVSHKIFCSWNGEAPSHLVEKHLAGRFLVYKEKRLFDQLTVDKMTRLWLWLPKTLCLLNVWQPKICWPSVCWQNGKTMAVSAKTLCLSKCLLTKNLLINCLSTKWPDSGCVCQNIVSVKCPLTKNLLPKCLSTKKLWTKCLSTKWQDSDCVCQKIVSIIAKNLPPNCFSAKWFYTKCCGTSGEPNNSKVVTSE